MSTTTRRTIDPRTEPEQQPWRTPDDRRGWKVVAVGARHPGAFMREVQQSVQRHSPPGLKGSSAHRAAARAIVEALLGREPEATTGEEVRRIVCAAFEEAGGAAGASPSALAPLADEVGSAWRRYAAA